MDFKYTPDEQETTINMFPPSVSKKAEIFSCIPAMMDRLRELSEGYPADVAIVEKDGCVTATVPVSWVKIAPKRRSTMTDEQKKANAERLAAYREARKT